MKVKARVVELSSADVYGQIHPVETPERISSALHEFDCELQVLRCSNKVYVEQAQELCPELFTDDFKLSFLRSEVFHAKRAADRFANYWEKRIEVFGPDEAFRPLVMKAEGVQDILRMGVMNLFPCQGRCMVFMYPRGLDKSSSYSIPHFVKALWYVAHVALENKETARKGIVVVGFADKRLIKPRDFRLARAVINSTRGALPVRFSGYHICHPRQYSAKLWSVGRMIVGEHFFKRFSVHGGSEEEVLQSLEEKYGFDRTELPAPIGGGQKIDLERWIEERLQYEDQLYRELPN